MTRMKHSALIIAFFSFSLLALASIGWAAERTVQGTDAAKRHNLARRGSTQHDSTGNQTLPVQLRSQVALVVDQDTDEVLLQKNSHTVAPIASITKLMTALVTLEADLPLDEELVVTHEDRTSDRVRSVLQPGVRLTRAQALQLALMASENQAAQLLARTYPGGVTAFVSAMNAKAHLLGMAQTRFVEPTGLSPENRSSPQDLVRLVKAAAEHRLIREYSTAESITLSVGNRTIRYQNTNRLVASPAWQIGLQKTGYIAAAGRCLVMQALIQGRRVVMILLDSAGKYSRLADAQRIRAWIESSGKRA
ncbi:MAG: serine hydrolase [Sutterellaceae bacterium]|nr:serine hydrolase [Burkholderiaceae bacterium]MDW8429313.1 serine hydrolase [Sutterellaceae bacterium]